MPPEPSEGELFRLNRNVINGVAVFGEGTYLVVSNGLF
jgi:hypothetical protein